MMYGLHLTRSPTKVFGVCMQYFRTKRYRSYTDIVPISKTLLALSTLHNRLLCKRCIIILTFVSIYRDSIASEY